MSDGTDYTWTGEHAFAVPGTVHHEDTLHITCTGKVLTLERTVRLILPTLCITYADMAFANAIGGEQSPYPASQAYGPAHFTTPRELSGAAEIEAFTWIRGAERVRIGPRETVIEWYPRNALIVPRLRIEADKTAAARVAVDAIPVSAGERLCIDVMQIADGRPIGGLRIEHRHPAWKPPPPATDYELVVSVVDGVTGDPIPEAPVHLARWQPDSGSGESGTMVPLRTLVTDGDGRAACKSRCDLLEAASLDLPGWRAVARSFRPLAGQVLHIRLLAWKLRPDVMRYRWRSGDSLSGLASLCGHPPRAILRANRLPEGSLPLPGMEIDLPCWAAQYRLEPDDRVEWLAQVFAEGRVDELLLANGIRHSDLAIGQEIILPGWRFLYAPNGSSLAAIDAQFELPEGSSRVVGRAHHPDPATPFEAETLALPIGKGRHVPDIGALVQG